MGGGFRDLIESKIASEKGEIDSLIEHFFPLIPSQFLRDSNIPSFGLHSTFSPVRPPMHLRARLSTLPLIVDEETNLSDRGRRLASVTPLAALLHYHSSECHKTDHPLNWIATKAVVRKKGS